MNIRLQIIIAIILIIALCVIVNMIRKKRLELRYALAWLIVGVGTLVLDCFPILTTKLAELIGVASPINMLFFLGFCFSLVIIFVLTVAISRVSIRMKQLTQELALYEKKMNDELLEEKRQAVDYRVYSGDSRMYRNGSICGNTLYKSRR